MNNEYMNEDNTALKNIRQSIVLHFVRQLNGFSVLVIHNSLLDCVLELGLNVWFFADLLV